MRVVHSRSRLRLTALCSAFALLLDSILINGCGGGFIAVDLNTIAAITSSANVLRVNQDLQLSSRYMAAGLPMIFSVNGIPGGNSTVGTISSTGHYTAPAVVPNPYTVQITATIAKYPNAVPGSVSVQIWNPIPTLSTVSPSAITEGTTTVIASGSQFVYEAEISWNGALIPTTYVSGSELVAEIAAPIPGTYPPRSRIPIQARQPLLQFRST